MTNKSLTVFIAAAAFLVLAAPVIAHHSRSNYDMEHVITVKGVVTEFEYSNPHTLIHIDVTDENGKVEKWIGEGHSPNVLSRQGWNRNTIKTGDKIELTGHRVKNGANYMDYMKVKMPDGKELAPTVSNY